MKKKWILFSLFILILVFSLLPVNFLSANPVNLIKNGDFSDGLNYWTEIVGDVSIENNTVHIGPTADGAYIVQGPDTSRKNLKLSFDIKPINFGIDDFYAGFTHEDNGILTYSFYNYPGLLWNEWTRGLSFYLSDCWYDNWGTDFPDYDSIWIWVSAGKKAEAYFDNIKLEAPGGGSEQAEEPEIWVRNHEMQCWQVWINDDNAFEFVFVWEYANNNHVQIFDMAGNLVFETDMEKGNAHFVAPLPDGMYTVKTFHEAGHILQEFIIGKP